MNHFPHLFDKKPAPKPVSAARWVPLANKHGMMIDFEIKCVSTIAPGFNEFWGSEFFEPDVGACVVKVAGMIAAAKNEVKS